MTRPRLQLHLSTLLIVSLLAAGLVWLNVREDDMAECRGWPVSYMDLHYEVLSSGSIQGNEVRGYAVVDKTTSVSWRYLVADLATCLTLLAVATAAIEWATRRMKRGAP